MNRLSHQAPPLPVLPSCAAPMDLSAMSGRLQLPPPPELPAWLYPEADVHPAPLYSPRVSGLAPLPDDVEEAFCGSAGVTDTVKVKNTFIEVNGGLDLKSMLQEGRQIRSCPGSRLTSPRGKGDVGRPTASSQASTADTTEAERLNRDSLSNFPELEASVPLYPQGRIGDAARAALAHQAQAEQLHFETLAALEHPASSRYYDQRAE